jgi:hypothetical protein
LDVKVIEQKCMEFMALKKSVCYVFNFLTLILIINIPHNVWIVENIFTNKYTSDECNVIALLTLDGQA